MTKRELVGLFAALREIAKPSFWFWLPRNPITGLSIVALAVCVFIRDVRAFCSRENQS